MERSDWDVADTISLSTGLKVQEVRESSESATRPDGLQFKLIKASLRSYDQISNTEPDTVAKTLLVVITKW